MPTIKNPCLQCKEKHVRCDEGRPKCRRCSLKLLPCSRPERKTVFRHGTVGHFARDQRWVSGNAKGFRLDRHSNQDISEGQDEDIDFEEPSETASSQWNTPNQHQTSANSSKQHSPHMSQSSTWDNSNQRTTMQRSYSDEDARLPSLSNLTHSQDSMGSQPFHYLPGGRPPMQGTVQRIHRSPAECQLPLEDPQEACLFRYYVEELSQWFDLCDEQRHFQQIVPSRACHQPHLLNAIFALSARHLRRVPEFKTPRGILFHGQLLTSLHENASVEYMLKCIPALRQFHESQDDEYRDSIIATAVILRQLEEIDDEERHSLKDGEDEMGEARGLGLGPGPGGAIGGRKSPSVTFLAVIDSVLRSPISQALFKHRTLIQASYWMALRQEIFHSFTKRQPPHMFLSTEYWLGASPANKTVIHTIQVAKWLWGDRSGPEWSRLMQQQQHLEEDVLVDFRPIFRRAADKSKGEIFPTIWYSSNTEVVSMLLAITSKMVLVAEDPGLRVPGTPRSSWRAVETQVRMLTLELCGIALCNSASPATLVNAAIGIQLYGDYFTDHYERRALKGVVEKYRDAHAWPVQELLDMFQ